MGTHASSTFIFRLIINNYLIHPVIYSNKTVNYLIKAVSSIVYNSGRETGDCMEFATVLYSYL